MELDIIPLKLIVSDLEPVYKLPLSHPRDKAACSVATQENRDLFDLNVGLMQLSLEPEKLISSFEHYLSLQNQTITRAMADEPLPTSAAEVATRFGTVLQIFPGLAAGSLVFGAWSAAIFSVFFSLLQLLCLRRRRKKLVLL